MGSHWRHWLATELALQCQKRRSSAALQNDRDWLRCLAGGCVVVWLGKNAGKIPALPGAAARPRGNGLPVYEAFGEGVVAGADAHGVVPGDGEGPPR
jgi:hypothetical protein